jgi:hypothetical protein
MHHVVKTRWMGVGGGVVAPEFLSLRNTDLSSQLHTSDVLPLARHSGNIPITSA